MLPASARERRVIVVMRDHEFAKLDISTAGQTLKRDASVAIVTWPLAADASGSEVLERLDREGLLEEGALLVQSPFDPERYLKLSEATTIIARTKLLLTIEVCRQLGASAVTITEIRLSASHGSAVWTAGVGDGVNGVAAGLTRSDLEAFVQRTQVTDRFVGGDPDVDRAMDILRSTGLAGDDDLCALISARTGSNRILSRQVQLSTANETHRVADRLLKVEAAGLVELGARFNSVAEQMSVFNFSLSVEFPT